MILSGQAKKAGQKGETCRKRRREMQETVAVGKADEEEDKRGGDIKIKVSRTR